MKESAGYAKIVDSSDTDACFVRRSPGLFYGGCHSNNEAEAYAALCQIVDEWIEIFKQDGRPLQPATAAQ